MARKAQGYNVYIAIIGVVIVAAIVFTMLKLNVIGEASRSKDLQAPYVGKAFGIPPTPTPVTSLKCDDIGDNGFDPYKQGLTSANSPLLGTTIVRDYKDYCSSDSRDLVEYYCGTDEKPYKFIVNCPSIAGCGSATTSCSRCSNGVCI